MEKLNQKQKRMLTTEISDLVQSFIDYNAKDWDNIPNTDKQSLCELRAETILHLVDKYLEE